tara:strand:+ start:1024 stop:1317 length:294 start_codon:yes stop_codon:yes gene_type:complete
MTEVLLIIGLVSFPEIYGFLAAALTTIAFLPQLIRTLKTRSADDISFLMLILFITGLLFWIIYGIKIDSRPIILANLITFSLNLSILILKILFKKNK